MFQTFAVTYALMTIGVEAGHPDFGIYFPNRIKRSAIKQAKESNRGWGKWQRMAPSSTYGVVMFMADPYTQNVVHP